MPRTARVTKVKTPHHVYQRTANDQVLFSTNKDRLTFLEILRKNASLYGADILAWCLMRKHFNLLVVPLKKDALSRVIGRTMFDYSNYVVRKRDIEEPFWHNRFQSCIIEEDLREEITRYIECQPVYEGKARKAQDYPWSSAKTHITWNDEHDILSLDVWPPKRTRSTWARKLDEELTPETQKKIRIHTQTGRPIGSEKFIKSLERQFKRPLMPVPIGRPRLNKK